MILLSGTASYYSTTGCLGCNKEMIMANGKKLNDSALTIAMSPKMVRKYKLLNKYVLIKNPTSGKEINVKVTDTGGFEKYNRVADLTIATRDALKCKNLCEVEIKIKL